MPIAPPPRAEKSSGGPVQIRPSQLPITVRLRGAHGPSPLAARSAIPVISFTSTVTHSRLASNVDTSSQAE
jgi:hypothetical protein